MGILGLFKPNVEKKEAKKITHWHATQAASSIGMTNNIFSEHKKCYRI